MSGSGEKLVGWKRLEGGDKTPGVVDISSVPHPDNSRFPSLVPGRAVSRRPWTLDSRGIARQRGCNSKEHQSMTVYFVRHADKESGDFLNPVLRHQDQPISRAGRRQSRRLRDYLMKRQISRVYVSEYLRTRQTIAPFSRSAGIAPVVDSRLNEIDIGLVEGMPDEVVQSRYPDVWKAYIERTSDFRFPEGETGGEASDRVASFLEEQRHRSGNAVAVAHDGIIRALLCHVLGIPVYRRSQFRCGTTGVLELALDDRRDAWIVVRFNQEL